MTKRRKKSLTRQILFGMMAAGMLWSGFAAQAEAATVVADVTINKATGDGAANACNTSHDMPNNMFGPGASDKIYAVGYVGDGYTANASGNTLNITNPSFSYSTVAGGPYKYTIYGGFVSGDAAGGDASNNIVNINGGTYSKTIIYGGQSLQANAEGNIVNINGGNFSAGTLIYGGSGMGNCRNNVINIKGGKFQEDTEIHSADSGTDGNIVNIEGGDFGAGTTSIYSGYINIKVDKLTLKKIADTWDGGLTIKELNFYIPNTVTKDSTILTINGDAPTNLTNTKVSAGVANGSPLTKGDKITLLYNENTITTIGMTTGKLTDAGFLNYDLTIATSADAKSLIATIGDVSGGGGSPLDPKTKSLAETRAGGIAILNDGATLMAGTSLVNAKAAAKAANLSAQGGEGAPAPAGFTPFAAVGANNMRYETGSYVDSKGWGINVGMARELTYKKSLLTIAPVIEYGRSSYDSYLDSGTHGSGKQQFLGAGAIVRQDFTKGTYVEGSLRAGRMKGDYNSGDTNASYDTASNYLGLHLGVGKIVNLDKKNKLDIYGKLFYTKQAGDDVKLSTGAVYNFEAIDSVRTRLGARWTAELAKNSSLYVGLAWDHEFDSKARATYKGFSTPSPSMKGDSCLLELGWQVKPKETSPLSINLNLTGWCGKQKGVQFGAGFEWGF